MCVTIKVRFDHSGIYDFDSGEKLYEKNIIHSGWSGIAFVTLYQGKLIDGKAFVCKEQKEKNNKKEKRTCNLFVSDL